MNATEHEANMKVWQATERSGGGMSMGTVRDVVLTCGMFLLLLWGGMQWAQQNILERLNLANQAQQANQQLQQCRAERATGAKTQP